MTAEKSCDIQQATYNKPHATNGSVEKFTIRPRGLPRVTLRPSSPSDYRAGSAGGRKGPAPRHPWPNSQQLWIFDGATTSNERQRFQKQHWIHLLFVLVACLLLPVSVVASALPSLFRGVVVADSSVGVRVVSVQDGSQAFLADLRPDDVIVRIDDQEVHSIDDFATLSTSLKGHTISAKIVIFRNGAPQEVVLHLYSYPIFREWGIEFIPDHDIRFADPQVGLEYWRRLGRGFEQAQKPADALNAYLNGLHNVPTDTATAFTVSALLLQVSRTQLDAHQMTGGINSLRQSLVMLQKLFDSSLSDDQLQAVRDQLRATLQTLHRTTTAPLMPAK